MKPRWPTVLFAVVLIVLVTAVIGLSWSAASLGLPNHRAFSVLAALIASIAIIAIAYAKFFGLSSSPRPKGPPLPGPTPTPTPHIPEKPKQDDDPIVAESIAFNLVVFLVLGFATVVVATRDWPVAFLWAGAALFAGGVVGLIFGMPLSDAGPAKHGAAGTTASGGAGTGSGRTVLSDAAGTFRTFVSGALVATARDLFGVFKDAANSLAKCLDCCTPGNSSLAGGLIVYFLSLGFVAGLVLPRYFLGRVLEALGSVGGGQPTPTPRP
ncbi:MAG: hypothetical protein ABSC93_15715 [Bryobacteraceae bacterium]|jgi:hypothetical protein